MARVNNRSFLKKREQIKIAYELTSLIVLGYGLGLILIIFGAFKYLCVIGAYDEFWICSMILGSIIFFMALIKPIFLMPLNNVLKSVGSKIGEILLFTILAICYYIIITPVGYFLKKFNSGEIANWRDINISTSCGQWHDKILPIEITDITSYSKQRYKFSRGIFGVIKFFINNGKFFFIPILIILIAIGVFLFFLQTSIIAPFIYTLF